MHMNPNNNYSLSDLVSWLKKANITVIQSSKLSTLRSTFGRVPVNFFNCSGWNSFNSYMNFSISSKIFTDHDVWPPFWPLLFQHKISAVESADQTWWWIIVVRVHMHHSQPLKIKFGINHFLEFWFLVLL